jgi:small subunit ribosomal protein S17
MAKNNEKTKVAEKAAISESTTKRISTRGNEFEGVVTSAKAAKTVTVSWERRRYVKKYERYEKRRSKVAAHVPDEMTVKEGDVVQIKETRPLSKTKHFIVTKIVEENR